LYLGTRSKIKENLLKETFIQKGWDIISNIKLIMKKLLTGKPNQPKKKRNNSFSPKKRGWRKNYNRLIDFKLSD
jgi:hypothetical protein